MQSDTCTEQERKLYIDINGIEQANHVLTDYLTFAKPSIEKEQQLQIEEELLHALSLITPLANLTNVRIHYIKQSTSFFIAGEKQKLNQCLLNIFKNCIEAMPTGGDLVLTLVPEHKHIQLYIKDTGIGMDQEQVKRLGSPFYSTKEKGTGLGMMVVFSVVQAMNGKIDIISEKGTGTTFLLTFPLIQKRDEILITFFLQLIQQKLSLCHVVLIFFTCFPCALFFFLFLGHTFQLLLIFLSVYSKIRRKTMHIRKSGLPLPSNYRCKIACFASFNCVRCLCSCKSRN